jgi:hypothetical protein
MIARFESLAVVRPLVIHDAHELLEPCELLDRPAVNGLRPEVCEIAHFKTDNDIPNNDYRNVTYAGRFGVVAGSNTTVSSTLRWFDTAYGNAYRLNYFRVPDDARIDDHSMLSTVTAQSQWNDRFRTTARYGIWNQHAYGINPTPTGIARGIEARAGRVDTKSAALAKLATETR